MSWSRALRSRSHTWAGAKMIHKMHNALERQNVSKHAHNHTRLSEVWWPVVDGSYLTYYWGLSLSATGAVRVACSVRPRRMSPLNGYATWKQKYLRNTRNKVCSTHTHTSYLQGHPPCIRSCCVYMLVVVACGAKLAAMLAFYINFMWGIFVCDELIGRMTTARHINKSVGLSDA